MEHRCLLTSGRRGLRGSPRMIAARMAADKPMTETRTQSLFETLGGEPGIRRLVDDFYDVMDDANRSPPAFGHCNPAALEGSRDKFFWFLCGWSGGPDHYIERFGHPAAAGPASAISDRHLGA